MDKSNIEKWKDGSIVDDWMKSKAYQKFYFYHPYPTYSDNSNDCFVKPDGTRCEELTADTEALFILGEKTFSRLPKAATSKDFDGALAGYFQFIDELRDSLSKSYKEGRFKISNPKGDVYQPNFDEADNGWILDLAWNCFAKPLSSLSSDREEIATCYQEAFLFHVFYEIDNALIAIDLGGGAAAASIGAANALANALSIESGNENLQQVRREMALQGAIAKHEKTYKKRQQVIEYWREHIPYDTPIERAAEWLKDSFSDIAHRTLCRYVSEAKKEAKP